MTPTHCPPCNHDCDQGRTCPARDIKVPIGYTAAELERDSPYNQWMHEAEVQEAENEDSLEEPEEDDGYCFACAGTGEGQYDGAACRSCGGRGFKFEKAERDE